MKLNSIWKSVCGLAFLITVNASAEESKRCVADDWDSSVAVYGKVVRVVDGDTVRVKTHGKEYPVRLLTIDTPETHFQGKSQGYWGDHATNQLTRLLPAGASVKIEFDHSKCDKYGRLLAYLWKDDLHINRKMLELGLAVNYCYFPSRYCLEFAEVAQESIDESRGIFGDKSVELPYEWRRIQSHRAHEKYVGDIYTYEVYEPGALDRVPVANRVFFVQESDIQPPFRLAE